MRGIGCGKSSFLLGIFASPFHIPIGEWLIAVAVVDETNAWRAEWIGDLGCGGVVYIDKEVVAARSRC